ncbi:hypothetical protein [Caballeronia terrestris]|nr:hypothetical protein [Caballeronia terrestris]
MLLTPVALMTWVSLLKLVVSLTVMLLTVMLLTFRKDAATLN